MERDAVSPSGGGGLIRPVNVAVQKMLREENADRERMFMEIAAATDTDPSQLPRIRERYASTLRANARRGDWRQKQ